eukprot:TRINITY_DN796_c0_g1_i2.p1 TRINITY_DN796_c0_g1~~TRINITY_DN796_c0_g1_i2.p1  ORF type:complete len:191 (-),score=47.69 TRINITY_DN796_c0_g1_i2:78-650(-)
MSIFSSLLGVNGEESANLREFFQEEALQHEGADDDSILRELEENYRHKARELAAHEDPSADPSLSDKFSPLQSYTDAKFAYAHCLVSRKDKGFVGAGIRLLNELNFEEESREYLYYLAVASFKLGDYVEARSFTERLLVIEPNNKQAQALKLLIEDQLKKDGVIGAALVGTAAATAAVALAAVAVAILKK